jgi:hypothetical protein
MTQTYISHVYKQVMIFEHISCSLFWQVMISFSVWWLHKLETNYDEVIENAEAWLEEMQALVTNRYGRVHTTCVLNIKIHTERRDIKPSSLNLGTSWWRVFKFTPNLGEPLRWSGGIQVRPPFSLITIAIILSQLLFRKCNLLKSQRSF